jgi:hypothetical protein
VRFHAAWSVGGCHADSFVGENPGDEGTDR